MYFLYSKKILNVQFKAIKNVTRKKVKERFRYIIKHTKKIIFFVKLTFLKQHILWIILVKQVELLHSMNINFYLLECFIMETYFEVRNVYFSMYWQTLFQGAFIMNISNCMGNAQVLSPCSFFSNRYFLPVIRPWLLVANVVSKLCIPFNIQM